MTWLETWAMLKVIGMLIGPVFLLVVISSMAVSAYRSGKKGRDQ